MKHLFIIMTCLFLSVKVFAQPNNLHFIHFTGYTVETDKIVQDALKSEKVTYTCIPAGILAIEIPSNDAEGEARIAQLLRKKGLQSSSFEFVVLTLETAESSCATFRKP
jgi:hypothetical protein